MAKVIAFVVAAAVISVIGLHFFGGASAKLEAAHQQRLSTIDRMVDGR